MRKTKIVCTIGPACRDRDTLIRMIEAGMNVARLNFSHGTHEYHAETIKLLKEIRHELGVPLGIMLDTKGPEIRLKDFEGGSAMLEDGQLFVLTNQERMGDSTGAQMTFDKLPQSVAPGNTLLIDDGKIVMQVEETTETEVVCRVVHGGKVSNHKGINVPNVHLDMPVLGEKDKEDLLFGIEQDVDLVAASFVPRSKTGKASTISRKFSPCRTASWSPAAIWAWRSSTPGFRVSRSPSSGSATARGRWSSPPRRCWIP